MSLLTDPKYSKSIDVDQCDKDSEVFYSFYSIAKEYEPYIDNIAQVSKDTIKIFDS